MKKLLFICLAILTCYLAGVYRYPALMLLFVIEAILYAVSCFLPYYFRKNLKLAFLRHSEVMEKELPLDCVIAAENKGGLPISRFRIKLQYAYGKNKKNTKQICGGLENGKTELHFQLAARYCGMIQLDIAAVSVYDYLALCSKKKKWKDSVEIAVFPSEKALQIELVSSLSRESLLPQEQQPGWSGDARDEIRQLREYRAGDSNRHIHWNQSAKMDSIWIKEFEKETDRRPELLLDMEGIENATRQQLDAFYEVLSAIVHGLFCQEGMACVSWYCAEKKMVEYADIRNTTQCRDMLLRLYRSEPSQCQWAEENHKGRLPRPQADISKPELASGPDLVFKLDLALNWYQNETLIFRFSQEPEVLTDQIKQKVFVI